MDNCAATTKKVVNDNDNLQRGDKKMPWVQKVAILDTRQKVGLKHQQTIEVSVSIRIHMGHFPQDGENEQNLSEFFCF